MKILSNTHRQTNFHGAPGTPDLQRLSSCTSHKHIPKNSRNTRLTDNITHQTAFVYKITYFFGGNIDVDVNHAVTRSTLLQNGILHLNWPIILRLTAQNIIF